ncbi:MAG: carbohydrate ABC transporter permease [Anaerolineae bacterium]|nr:carbohydrate ABC transporter permease [Anaerolineae bacterium]
MGRALIYATLIGLLLVLFFPVFWLISTSLKTSLDVYRIPPAWIPYPITFKHYTDLWSGYVPFPLYLRNSVITCTATSLLATAGATLAGYALSRLTFPGKRPFLLLILATQMFPHVLILISLYVMYRELHLMDTHLGLILAFTTFAVPFSVWMMKGFFDSVPAEIEEAALIDGCTRLRALWSVVLPLVSPGLLAVALFSFLDAWNNLLYPLTLATSNEVRTIPPGLLLSFLGQFKQDWGGMMAASVVVTVPTTIIFILLQRYLVRGLTAGAVKG